MKTEVFEAMRHLEEQPVALDVRHEDGDAAGVAQVHPDAIQDAVGLGRVLTDGQAGGAEGHGEALHRDAVGQRGVLHELGHGARDVRLAVGPVVEVHHRDIGLVHAVCPAGAPRVQVQVGSRLGFCV